MKSKTLALCLFLLATSIRIHAQEAKSLQDLAVAAEPLPTAIRFTAKEILTLDPAKPKADAVAVVGSRILAVGTLDELKAAAGDQLYRVDDRFAGKVMVPGFIAQHDHPLLGALTVSSEIISIEDWVLPSGTIPAAKNHEDYIRRLTEAQAKMTDPKAVLLTWGFHHYFHGKLTRADLDKISATRPIIVWHRSAHEFMVNTAALEAFGVNVELVASLPKSARDQSDYEKGHFWEQGLFGVLGKFAPAVASPQRLNEGLPFVEQYLQANGVTVGCEPGELLSKKPQEAQNAVFSDSATPFRFYFIADGKSITAAHSDDKVIQETEKLLTCGEGHTAYLPKMVKLFADGAIYSQAMQVREP